MTAKKRAPKCIRTARTPFNPDDSLRDIRTHLVAAREALNLSREEVAEEIGVGKSVQGKYERGVVIPPVVKLLHLGKALHIPKRRLLSPRPSPVLDEIVEILEEIEDEPFLEGLLGFLVRVRTRVLPSSSPPAAAYDACL